MIKTKLNFSIGVPIYLHKMRSKCCKTPSSCHPALIMPDGVQTRIYGRKDLRSNIQRGSTVKTSTDFGNYTKATG